MTPGQITALRRQFGLSQQGFADRLREVDPLLAPNRHTVSRWESSEGPKPNAHALAALTRLWLDAGYPAAANGQPATITTNHPASSYGLPVVVINGQAHGAAEVDAVTLHDAPAGITEATRRAGYTVEH